MKNILWWLGGMAVVLLALAVTIELTDDEPKRKNPSASGPVTEQPLPTFKVQ